MSDQFKFETFVDVHNGVFAEYLSSVIGKLSKENKKYRAVQNKIEGLYEKYPKVLEVFDSEQPADLTREESRALIKVLELKTNLYFVRN